MINSSDVIIRSERPSTVYIRQGVNAGGWGWGGRRGSYTLHREPKWVHLGRSDSEVLRSLKHYMRAQSQGTRRHRSPEGERRGRCSERGRERDGISQTNLATVLKATRRKLLRDVVGRVIVYVSSERIDSILN